MHILPIFSISLLVATLGGCWRQPGSCYTLKLAPNSNSHVMDRLPSGELHHVAWLTWKSNPHRPGLLITSLHVWRHAYCMLQFCGSLLTSKLQDLTSLSGKMLQFCGTFAPLLETDWLASKQVCIWRHKQTVFARTFTTSCHPKTVTSPVSSRDKASEKWRGQPHVYDVTQAV